MNNKGASNRSRSDSWFLTRARSLRWVATAILLTASPLQLRAQEALEYLPEDALGFVLVRDLTESSKKYEHLLKIFDAPLPEPLALVKFATGLGPGLDLDGDLLICLIPGPQSSSSPEPLVLLPLADYAKFAASVGADDSGEVSRATIAGEDVLVARHGPFAMIMNVENRETLEILVGLDPKPVALISPVSDWLQHNQTTVVVLPSGLKLLLELGSKNLAEQRRVSSNNFGGLGLSVTLASIHRSNALCQALLDMSGKKFDLIACGLSLDEASNLRVSLRMLSENALWGSRAAPATKRSNPLSGFPEQPFIVAGGGPLDHDWVNLLIETGVSVIRQMPETYGYENFSDKQWQELETSYQHLFEGVRSASLLMLPGERGEPLFSNVFVTAQVDDAAQYLQMPKRFAEIQNRLTTQSTTDIPMQLEINEIKVNGQEACEVVVDVAAAARDPNVPIWNWMLEAMFGKEGKLQTLVVAADRKTVVCGLADERRMSRVIDQVQRGETGLFDSEQLQSTHELLTPAAAWKCYVSPQACVTWLNRIQDELFGQIGAGQPTSIPEYDAGPPLGISLRLQEGQAEIDLVWPVEGLRSLAAYIKKCEQF